MVRAEGRIQGGRTRMKGMHPPTSHFQKFFYCIKFSVVSNLFDSDKPYAFSSGVARNFKRPWFPRFLGIFFFGRTNRKLIEKQERLWGVRGACFPEKILKIYML